MNALLEFSEKAFAWTWQTSISAAVLVGLVFLAQKLTGRWLTPGWRHVLSLLILVRLLLPVAPASRWSLQNFLQRPATPMEVVFTPPVPVEAGVSVDLAPDPVVIFPAAAGPQPRMSWRAGLTLVWVSGFLGLVALSVWRYGRWRRLIAQGRTTAAPRLLELLDEARKDMGVGRAVRLVTLPRWRSPGVFGIWRPCLLLPETAGDELSDEELRMIFLHELAHIRRQDVGLNLLLMGAQFVHWFNPLVWLAGRWIRADRELVCDAMTLRHLPAEGGARYGHLLLKLMDGISEGTTVLATGVPMAGSKQEIKRRLIMIKHQRRSSLAGRVATAAGVAALACATFTRAQEAAPNPAVLPTPGYQAGPSLDSQGQIYVVPPNAVYQAGPSVEYSGPNPVAPGPNSPNPPPYDGTVEQKAMMRPFPVGIKAAGPAAADSVEGKLAAEGKKWVAAPGFVRVGGDVQDVLQGRLDQPEGRGTIAKVISMDEYIGMEHAWVDFGRGTLEHIRTSELCPIRFITNAAAEAAADSVESRLALEGMKWEKTDGPVRPGNYAQDTVEKRPGQPAGRGSIGKVMSLDEFNNAEHAWVDFGRGWIIHVPTAELAPLRIMAPEGPVPAPVRNRDVAPPVIPATGQPTAQYFNNL